MRSEALKADLAIDPRAHDVMALVCHGMTSVEIGKDLGMSPGMVDDEIDEQTAKLGARNRAQAAAKYVAHLRTQSSQPTGKPSDQGQERRRGLIDKLPSASLHASTPRHKEILLLISKGLTNEQIGKQLAISLSTAKLHVHNASARIYAKNRVHAAAIYANAMFEQQGAAGSTKTRDANRKVDKLRSMERHHRMLTKLRREGFDALDVGVILGTRIGFVRGHAGLVLGISPLALAMNEN